MKLIIHDEKHERVLAELELGELSSSEQTRLEHIFTFLDNHDVTNRYKRLQVVEEWCRQYHDGEPFISYR